MNTVKERDDSGAVISSVDSHETSEDEPAFKLLQGWRLGGVLFGLAFGLLLAVIETSITATALVSISKHFGDSVNATWVVLAYLLSYMGFAAIFTRLSDSMGRQEVTVAAWVIFGAFSLGGGLAKTLNQLIVCRVIQGVGGSGLYSMIMVVGPEITPPKYWGAFSGIIGMTIATGSILGPILGGAITTHTTWRWIYLFNAPCAIIAVPCLLICWPGRAKKLVSLASLRQIDFLGATLLLGASTLLIFALQEAGADTYQWSSSTIISTLVVSSICWLAFFSWMLWLSFGKRGHHIHAILPLNVALSRPTGPAIITILLSGFPYYIAIINLPQRFQIVNQDSPIRAGVNLLPLLCSMAFGSGLGGAVSGKKNITSHTLIVAAAFIVLGCGLLSTLTPGKSIPRAVYGYQFLLGLGTGLANSAVVLMITLANPPEFIAAAQGAVSQARVLGGSIGLAIATIILNQKLRSDLSSTLTSSQLKNLEEFLNSLSSLERSEQAAVAQVYTDSFNQQMRICTYLSAVCVIAALGTFSTNPPSVAARRAAQEKSISGQKTEASCDRQET